MRSVDDKIGGKITLNNNIIAGLGKAKQFAFWGAGGGAIGALIAEILYPIIIQDNSKSLGNTVIQVAIWFGIIGATIAIALLSASFQYLKRGIQLGQATQNGIGVGLLAGAIAFLTALKISLENN
ncbi:hypothetical protein BCV64_02660 [Cylindrospermopsis raciborskii MVCC14]|nr:hypothetical protein BCV64_02660 [Cylindrospermopsis raciborskii MVCC14]